MDGLIAYALSKKYVDGKTSGITTGMNWKGTKENISSLPQSGNKVGDLWHVNEDGNEYAWDGSKWEALGGIGSPITVDSALSSTSENPVQNKVVKAALDGKQDTLTAGQNVTISGNTISADVDSAEIAADVTDWLDANVTPVGSAVVVDSSLSIEGAAADAKVVGDRFNEIDAVIGDGGSAPKPITWVIGKSLDTIGNPVVSPTRSITELIPVKTGDAIRYDSSAEFVYSVHYYGEDESYIGLNPSGWQAENLSVVQDGYIRFVAKKNSDAAFTDSDLDMLESGLSLLGFVSLTDLISGKLSIDGSDELTDSQKVAVRSAIGAEAAGAGLSSAIKNALLACFEHVAWANAAGKVYYDALYEALMGESPVDPTDVIVLSKANNNIQIGAFIYDYPYITTSPQGLTRITALGDNNLGYDVSKNSEYVFTVSGASVNDLQIAVNVGNQNAKTAMANGETLNSANLESTGWQNFNNSYELTIPNAVNGSNPVFMIVVFKRSRAVQFTDTGVIGTVTITRR